MIVFRTEFGIVAGTRYRASEGRPAEFAAGRVALYAAVAESVGREGPCSVERSARGAPLPPGGLSGSIAHEGGAAFAIAGAARAGTLGVDFARFRPIRPELSRVVHSAAERASHAGECADDVVVRFALKEAFYKSLAPLGLQHLEPGYADADVSLPPWFKDGVFRAAGVQCGLVGAATSGLRFGGLFAARRTGVVALVRAETATTF